MTAPERIWAEHRTCTVDASGATRLLAMDEEFARGTEYIRADLLETHIGAVLAEAAEIVECGCGEDGCEMPLSCFRKDAQAILALRPTALTALDRAKREARVEGMRGLFEVIKDLAVDGAGGPEGVILTALDLASLERALTEAERGKP